MIARGALGVGVYRGSVGCPHRGHDLGLARVGDSARGESLAAGTHGVRRFGAGGLDAGRARGVGRTRLTPRGVPRSGECACRALQV